MGANTKIEWTATRLPDGTMVPGHTFNPYRGCTKVSEGCKFCYAERDSKRNPAVLGEWGPLGTRVIASEKMWGEPGKWNAAAQAEGVRRKVFCASLADVFEDSTTMPAASWLDVQKARERLFGLIEQTPHLDWLLLTKRPHRVNEYVPTRWHPEQSGFPSNVWIGTSVENQEQADKRIPHLLSVPARVRFLSCEPLLGLVDLTFNRYDPANGRKTEVDQNVLTGTQRHYAGDNYTDGLMYANGAKIHWVIVGGESGPHARPLHPDWVRSLRNQCVSADVPFFFKQWGEYLPFEETAQPPYWRDQLHREWDSHGLDIIDPDTGDVGKGWHEDSLHSDCAWKKVGKQAAGRLLDGYEWNEFPSL